MYIDGTVAFGLVTVFLMCAFLFKVGSFVFAHIKKDIAEQSEAK